MTRRRLGAAFPTWREAIVGAPLWGLLLCASAAIDLGARGWSFGVTGIVLLLFFAGGCLAFPLALLGGRLLSAGRGRETAFASLFLCLAVTTTALIGALYALDYRGYYAQWHAPRLTYVWALQFFYTGLVALYQFAVLGVRLLFPLGFVGLFAASWLLSRGRH